MKKKDLYQFEPIAYLTTDFKEKFGIPRQSGMVKSARSVLKFNGGDEYISALKGIEGFSHLWVVFVFHDTGQEKWRPTIRPPRLGGAKRVGVLASRSPHRPNPIGLSVAEIDRIDYDAKNGVEIHLKGLDVLNGTPVLDIKPYLPYADSIVDARSGWAKQDVDRMPVLFSPEADLDVKRVTESGIPHFRDLVTEMLELDPRPASQRMRQSRKISAAAVGESADEHYGFLILDYDVQWSPRGDHFFVHRVIAADSAPKANKRAKTLKSR